MNCTAHVIALATCFAAALPLPSDLPQDDNLVFVGEAPAPESSLVLWYRRPAQRWLEALPVGNGRLGGDGVRWRHDRTAGAQRIHLLVGSARFHA